MKSVIFYLGWMILLSACEPKYSPKPKAFPKVNFPEKNYQTFSSDCPYLFEIPDYAMLQNEREFCWQNLDFNHLNATLYISYFPLNRQNKLSDLTEDSRAMVFKHTVKASSIKEILINRRDAKVYGLLYKIGGNTASSLQFYLTDSSNHFLRAALYFNSEPNIDSIAPVLDFISRDVDHMINTMKWKSANKD